ncbi:bifunctional hydroxymethylpyrimidine kinase/phosphomethylpyrimidine kinase [Fodinicola acaciae]|uniref:bifunctional hydroxymethylpyrimidine kinase/phosphomethylpyrimidine kinase n=1 Tax=Fodinicola acaciae TaxID=2681555 RepID=UPI0013D52E11|nr:bifunctional hydroxymethylpyrimidine kinase/phosphomethylpyrimidine kinase [Fodinicola acaciae]
MIPHVLTIAGTDPTGGAGIQADLKTFSALGGYGMTVVTAVVAQNTRGVRSIHPVPADFVGEQLDAVFQDVRVDAVKTGMLGDAGLIRTVAAKIAVYKPKYLIVDPVMVAKSGHRLLPEDAVRALRDDLLPLADLITPNLPEAADLLEDKETDDLAGMHEQAGRLRAYGPVVLLKGGHLAGSDSVDILLDREPVEFSAPRVETRNTHGTGCTLSSAITTLRPMRDDWFSAVREAKDYLTAALTAADDLDIGTGHGPPHHFHAIWKES